MSVVLMTYREKDSIRRVVQDFERTGVVDEILVIDNNAEDGTAAEVAPTSATRIVESRQGYGWATRRGLSEAAGDLIVLAEPDGTFLPSDIMKLLAYADCCDAVFGTRTNSELIWRDANMGVMLRWGNATVAKLIRALFRTAHLSDVGCTYKLLTADMRDVVLGRLTIGGSQLGPELMLQLIGAGARWVEVPVNYLPRVGKSSVTGEIHRAAFLGMQMVLLILRIRARTLGQIRRPEPLDASRHVLTTAITDLRDEILDIRDALHPSHAARAE